MNRVVELPYATTTAGISVFDRDNQYRPLQWLDRSSEIGWEYRENDSILLSILEKLPSTENVMDNPIVNWTEDSRLECATTFNSAMAVADTYLDLVDPYIVVVGSFIAIPATSELVEVIDVDYDKSEGWTNDAADTANVQVTRSMNGTAAVAGVINSYVIALPAFMAEQSDVRDGMGRLPEESQQNYISIISQSIEVTRLQNSSMVFDNWGQIPKAAMDAVFDVRQRLQYALLFSARATYATASEGQMYISQGALNYNKDGFLDLGTISSNLTWPILNDYLELRFQPDSSSATKLLLAGSKLYQTCLKLAKEMENLETRPYYDPDIGGMSFQMSTDGGYIVNVVHDRWGLQESYGLSDWGFLFDMKNIEGAHYKNLDFQWIQNIQARASVMQRKDAYIGSFSLIMKHQSTHGVIRGGSSKIVRR